jgi:hypothetical protein
VCVSYVDVKVQQRTQILRWRVHTEYWVVLRLVGIDDSKLGAGFKQEKWKGKPSQ